MQSTIPSPLVEPDVRFPSSGSRREFASSIRRVAQRGGEVRKPKRL